MSSSGWAAIGGVIQGLGGMYEDRQNEKRQEEFAQHGVQWRVNDAKAAGLHPLFALGANTPTYSPSASISSGLNAAGQGISNAAGRMLTDGQRDLQAAQLATLEAAAAKDDAMAAYYHSEAARNMSKGPSWPSVVPSSDQNAPLFSDAVKPKPDEVISSRWGDRSVTSGSHAGFAEYVIADTGLKIRLPQSDEGPGEALENVPWWMWPAIIQHNRSVYGSEWGTRFIREFMFGQKPDFRKAPRSMERSYRPGEDRQFGVMEHAPSDFMHGAP